MLLVKGRKEIPLVLTNSSSLSSSTINLFNLGNLTSGSNSGTTTNGQEIGIKNSNFTGATWRFLYNGGLSFYDVASPLNIDSLVTSLNSYFLENGQGIFWKEIGTGGNNWFLRTASSSYVFTTVTIFALMTKIFSNFDSGFVSGTSIKVSMETSVTYNEVSVELNTQPYIITTVYVYCPTQSQLSKPFSINKIDRSGTSSTIPFKPQLLPTQKQNVQMEIPIYMTTKNQNQLQYVLEPSASATMIVQYQNIGLFEAGELLQSGEFQYQMAILKKQDEIEYQRIMNIVSGAEIIADMEQTKQWSTTDFYSGEYPNPQPKQEIKYLVVPLIYVVAKENGIDSVLML